MGGAQQCGAFEWHDDLGVVALGELGQGLELQDRDQRGIGVRGTDCVVDAGNCFGLTLGFEDVRLPIAFGAKNRRGSLAFGTTDGCFGGTIGNVDRRLLVALGLQDLGPLYR